MDARFQPPVDKPQLNFEKTKERHIYAEIKDYDEDNKRMAAEMEELKKSCFSKDEIRKWLLGILAGNFIVVATSIWGISSWVTKKEAIDNSQNEKISDVDNKVSKAESSVTNFIITDNVIKEKNQILWNTYGTRLTILETEKKYKR